MIKESVQDIHVSTLCLKEKKGEEEDSRALHTLPNALAHITISATFGAWSIAHIQGFSTHPPPVFLFLATDM